MKFELISTQCAICETHSNSVELYPANFDDKAFSAGVFSARRLPDMVHYRIVRCTQCGLVRSDPVIDAESLNQLYLQSNLTYARDIPNLRRTYGRYLRKLAKYRTQKECCLEIGCGNGFFLEEALAQGYHRVLGVEPSKQAIEEADPAIRDSIYNDILRPGLLPHQVDTICMFQVFDHIPDPNDFLKTCFESLVSGGVIMCFNHNIRALSAQVLGEKSPIIDIEHTYLYSRETLRKLFNKNGFEVREAGMAWNHVSLTSLFRLFPFPHGIKKRILRYLERYPGLGQLSFQLPLGNLYLIAQKG